MTVVRQKAEACPRPEKAEQGRTGYKPVSATRSVGRYVEGGDRASERVLEGSVSLSACEARGHWRGCLTARR